jgi:hypothetical protein
MRSAVDPHLIRFVEQVSEGTSAAADSVAGLILRLVTRVGNLEKAVTAQASKLETLGKQPRGTPARAKVHDHRPQMRTVESGLDMHGDPVRIEERVRRPRGRPAGSRDSYQRHRPPRAPHNLEAELSSAYVDPDWDQMTG